MKRLLSAALAGCALIGAAHAQSGIGAALLTREEAIARALDDDPGIRAAAESVRAAEATAAQAGLRPNPSVDLQLEDFGGSGPFSGVDAAQATYSLAQKVELGGDRRARRRLADKETEISRVRADLSALDLKEAVEIAFAEAQAARAFADLASARLKIAREFSAAVDRRVSAARDPLAAKARVSAQLAEAEIEAGAAEGRARSAVERLASFWGGSADFNVETATLEQTAARPARQASPPDLALAAAEQGSAEARLDIERARRVPDPEFRAGFRQLQETDGSAFIVGVSVPLPIWNRNSGALAAARADQARAGYEAEARARALDREIAYYAAEADRARLQAETYAAKVIPHSEEALQQSFDGYSQGGLSYLEVLEAQSALADARERRVGALLTLRRAEARLARRGAAAAGASTTEENDQ
ncbi:MAG: TolC family protein [Pseudomonadota bacterium]